MHNKSVARVSDNEVVDSEDANGQSHKIVRTRESVALYSGPLPQPEMLEKYASLVPDAPERILRMAERQNEHRTEMEKIFIRGNFESEKRGAYFGFIIPIVGMICGTWIILSGKDITGFSTMFIALLPSAGSYVYGQYKKHQTDTSESTERRPNKDAADKQSSSK